MSRWFQQAFGSAVEDIRARMVDEAWFGRRAGSVHHTHTHEHHNVHDREAQDHASPEHGIDR